MMGNIGGIEKVMVFGILVIILTILAIAIYSATKVENDLAPNQLKAAGADSMIAILDPQDPVSSPQANQNPVQPVPFKDVLPVQPEIEANAELLKSNQVAGRKPGQNNNPGQNNRANWQQRRNQAQRANQPGANANANRNPQANRTQNEGAQNRNPAQRDQQTAPAANEYTVKPGDSFSSIARVLFGDDRLYKVLAAANPDIDPLNLQIGQKIKIPAVPQRAQRIPSTTTEAAVKTVAEQGDSRTYVVQGGDNLVKISQSQYGTSKRWKDIYNANRDVIDNPDLLKVGQRLRLP